MIVFEIWNIEQGKWIEANFATIPLGHYYLRIRDKLTLELKDDTRTRETPSTDQKVI